MKANETNFNCNPVIVNQDFSNIVTYNNEYPSEGSENYNQMASFIYTFLRLIEPHNKTFNSMMQFNSSISLKQNIQYEKKKGNLNENILKCLELFSDTLNKNKLIIIKKEIIENVKTIYKKEGSMKIECSQALIFDNELKLSKTIYFKEITKELKQEAKRKLSKEIDKLKKEFPHNDFLIFPSNSKCRRIEKEGEHGIEINLYYRGAFQFFMNFCNNRDLKQIIDFLSELAIDLLDLNSSLHKIILLSYMNIYTNAKGKPRLILFPSSFYKCELTSKNQKIINPILNPEINVNNDPKKYFSYFFGVIFLQCFFPVKKVQEFVVNYNLSKENQADKLLKFNECFNSPELRIPPEFIKALFSLCFLFEPKMANEINVIKESFMPALQKYYENKKNESRSSKISSDFKFKEEYYYNILNLHNDNASENKYSNILTNPNKISNNLMNQSFNSNMKIISYNKIKRNLKICLISEFNIYPFRKKTTININRIEGISTLSIPSLLKPILEIQKNSDKVSLSKYDYNKFKDNMIEIQKMAFPTYGIDPIVNMDLSRDTLDQKIWNEYTEEGQVKFFEVINFLKAHYEGIITKLIKIINHYEEIQTEFKKLFYEISFKKNRDELVIHLKEIASKHPEFNFGSKEIGDKLIAPETLFFKIYNELLQKKASRISIKALNNVYYLDLRELDLIDSKPDSKLLITVIRMNDLFNTIIINQYDFVKLIYEGRTKELGNSLQKEIFKKIKRLPYFFQIIFG